jgi:hypothetical protein
MKLLNAVLLTSAMAISYAMAQQSSTIGSGGSAATGGTSATTLGTGGTSTAPDGSTGSSIGSAGSAAADEGRVRSDTRIHENPNKLQGQSRATAQDGGTWSKSRTKTTVEEDGDLSSRTKSMSHEPGGPPSKSTTRVETPK